MLMSPNSQQVVRPWLRTVVLSATLLLQPTTWAGTVAPVADATPQAAAGGELMRSGDVMALELAEDAQAESLAAATASGGWPATSAWKVAASCPAKRFESYGFSYGGKLYIMGGWADSKFNSTTRADVYDPAKNTWSRLSNMQAPETHAGMTVDADRGYVYFVGGHRGKYPSTPTTDVWRYSINGDKWTRLGANLPYKMGANALALVNNKLHSFGGNYADRITNTADHFVLDLGNVGAGFKKAKPFPSPRDHLAHAVVNGKIYALGGEFGHDKKHDQQKLLHRYDPATDTWTRLADMPGSKSHAESSTFVFNGKILFCGGQTDPQSPTKSVYQFDPSTGKWSTLASLPTTRQGTTVQKAGSYLVFTVGGISTSQPQSTTWVAKLY